jgi:hypothetical protein
MPKIQIELPEYLMVKHWKSMSHLHSLNDREQMVAVISALTGYDASEIMEWNISAVIHVYNEVNNVLKNVNPEFYPLIEWEGQLYGYSNMSKMTLSEYIDVDTLTKDTTKNINDILALLYRPVTKNKVAGKYMVKSTLKALKYEVENIFDYYNIEKYDATTRKQEADRFDNFPIEIALGAISFFLGTKTTLLNGSVISSQQTIINQLQTVIESKMSKRRQQLLNITAGYLHSKNWAIPRSYQSQEIKP